MKQKLPVIIACISFLILGALITAGLFLPERASVRSERLFAKKAASAGTYDKENGASDKEKPERKDGDRKAEDDSKRGEEPYGQTAESPDDTAKGSETSDTAETDEITSNDEPAQDDLPVLPRYSDLLKINPYVSGWLKIDGTVIDEPVVYTPKSQNYFLHRAVDGSDAEKGTLFIAVLWRDDYNNTLIYGHNMRDGTGFGALKDYAKSSFGLSHSILHFDTLYEEREYQLFAVFYSQIEEEELETEEDRAERDKEIEDESNAKREEEGTPSEEPLTLKELDLYEDWGDVDVYRTEKDEDAGRFRYYYYTDLSDQADFEYYVNNIKERALYDTGVEVTWGDELLTLSTCSYHVKNGRLIVVAKRIK